MESDDEIIRLNHLWYYSNEVAGLMQISQSKFERELKPHRRALGPKFGMRWSRQQVKQIFYILLPHIHIIIE